MKEVIDTNILIRLLTKDALNWSEQGLDFPDALHFAKSQTETIFLTFDQKFIKRSHGIGNCEVKLPSIDIF